MKYLFLLTFLASLTSAMIWAFTGYPLWAPIHVGDEGRAITLFIMHVAGIVSVIGYLT